MKDEILRHIVIREVIIPAELVSGFNDEAPPDQSEEGSTSDTIQAESLFQRMNRLLTSLGAPDLFASQTSREQIARPEKEAEEDSTPVEAQRNPGEDFP